MVGVMPIEGIFVEYEYIRSIREESSMSSLHYHPCRFLITYSVSH